jgi:hypothetical protein
LDTIACLNKLIEKAIRLGRLVENGGFITVTDVITPYLVYAPEQFEPLTDYLDTLDHEVKNVGYSNTVKRVNLLVKIGWLQANDRLQIRINPDIIPWRMSILK